MEWPERFRSIQLVPYGHRIEICHNKNGHGSRCRHESVIDYPASALDLVDIDGSKAIHVVMCDEVAFYVMLPHGITQWEPV
jgi:hypothetical protein